MSKLYVAVRSDIPEGYQAVQGLHAAVNFCFDHPRIAGQWHGNSNTVVLLSVADEKEVLRLAGRAAGYGLAVTVFWEPDISAYTAVALEPGWVAESLCSRLSLAIREKESLWKRLAAAMRR